MAKGEILKRPLEVIAKSGFLTKELWREFMFRGNTQRGANWSWAKLRESGYFKPHPNPRIKDVLVLNRLNRGVMARLGGEAASPPHEGLFLHDEILLHGILKTESHGFLDHWFLEAELKVLGSDTFRITSAGNHIKFPDAILAFNTSVESIHVAIELELTMKDQKRYGQIMSSYSHMKGVHLVLFITKNRAVEEAINRAMREAYYPAHGVPVGFMSLTEWNEDPLLGVVRTQHESLSLGSFVTQSERAHPESTTSR